MFKNIRSPLSLPVIIGHVIMLFLLAIVALSGISGLNQVANSNKAVLDRQEEMADIRTLQIVIKTMDNSLSNYTYNGDPVDAQAFQNAITPLKDLLEEIAQKIRTEDERLNLNIIIRQTDQYIALFTDKIVPAREANDLETLQQLKDESYELLSQTDPFIKNMIAESETRAQEAVDLAQRTKNATTTIVVVLSIVAAAIGLTSAFTSATTISKNTDQILISSEKLRKSENALKESERFLYNVIENIPNMVFVKEAENLNYIQANRMSKEIFGLNFEKSNEKNDYDFFPQKMADFFRMKDREVLNSKKLLDIPEEQVQTTNSGIRLFHTKKIPILDETGTPKYLLGISEDITERKLAEVQIQQLNTELEMRVEKRTAQLEASNKELEAFSYSISHDLRAPLRAINGFSQIIYEDFANELPPDTLHYFDLIRKNTITMGQLVDDLLNFSRIGRQALNLKEINTFSLVKDVIETLQSENPSQNINIQITELPDCEADEILLRQVFMNLLSNAVKFTRYTEDSYIEIGYTMAIPYNMKEEKKEEVPCYYVCDNGVGFDMKYYDKLFGVFQRLHHAEDYEGTGVGLAFVHSIISKHNGQIWAKSAPNQGACFYFTLGETQ
jgi:PAS domain S-box-containing protein